MRASGREWRRTGYRSVSEHSSRPQRSERRLQASRCGTPSVTPSLPPLIRGLCLCSLGHIARPRDPGLADTFHLAVLARGRTFPLRFPHRSVAAWRLFPLPLAMRLFAALQVTFPRGSMVLGRLLRSSGLVCRRTQLVILSYARRPCQKDDRNVEQQRGSRSGFVSHRSAECKSPPNTTCPLKYLDTLFRPFSPPVRLPALRMITPSWTRTRPCICIVPVRSSGTIWPWPWPFRAAAAHHPHPRRCRRLLWRARAAAGLQRDVTRHGHRICPQKM